ncbi:fibronectin type III domain-containing protein [Nocardioides caldifontis]|uniref:fibronectin type III domain-containing protein n=1 Tax=Nocardioides caldifontis TaxID=2588938 RepID=UPI0011E019F4|nr:fibronectin type III domain-containing protein [Nocardioides caldifontis]
MRSLHGDTRRQATTGARVLALVAAMAAALAGIGTASPAAAVDPDVVITINPTTTPLSVYFDVDESWPPPGTSFIATTMSGTIESCPADSGVTRREMYLTQDGHSAWWTVGGAKGAWDWDCSWGPDISMQFAMDPAHPLHPGPATATIELWGDDPDEPVARVTRTVTIPASAPTVPTKVTGAMTSGTSARISWSPPVVDGGPTISGYRVARDGGTAGGSGWSTTVPGSARSHTFNNLRAGSTYALSVAAVNANGTGPTTTITVEAGTPGTPTSVTVRSTAGGTATLSWAPPTTTGGSAITGYRVSRDGGWFDSVLPWATTVSASTRSLTFRNLSPGEYYTFSVAATNRTGTGSPSSVSAFPVAPPSAPRIGTASAGTAGRPITATVRWSPTSGGSSVTGYVVRALRISGGIVVGTTTATVGPGATSHVMTLPRTGNYRFTVQATSLAGSSPQSARSNLVAGR